MSFLSEAAYYLNPFGYLENGISYSQYEALQNNAGYQPNLFSSSQQAQAQQVYNNLGGQAPGGYGGLNEAISPLPSVGDVVFGNGTAGSNPLTLSYTVPTLFDALKAIPPIIWILLIGLVILWMVM